VQRRPAAAHRNWRQAAVKRRQSPIIGDREGQEVSIRDMSRRRDTRNIDDSGVQKTEIIVPKEMAGQSAEARDDRRGGGRRTCRVWVSGMTDDADNAVLRDRTGCP
jgi:hypothetical protein